MPLNKLQEWHQKYTELGEEFERIKAEIVAKETKQEPWDVCPFQVGDEVYCVTSIPFGGLIAAKRNYTKDLERLWLAGIVFATESECLAAIARMEAEAKIRRYAKWFNKGWVPDFYNTEQTKNRILKQNNNDLGWEWDHSAQITPKEFYYREEHDLPASIKAAFKTWLGVE